MVEEGVFFEIIKQLQERYPENSEGRQNLRLNESLVKEIIEILEGMEHEVITRSSFPTENFSSTALSQFEQPLLQWIQTSPDLYIPTEQILRDLIDNGWIIKPPRGV